MFSLDWYYEEAVEKLWFSDKPTTDDRKFLDFVSTKKRFKFSEKELIQEMCIRIFGKFPID